MHTLYKNVNKNQPELIKSVKTLVVCFTCKISSRKKKKEKDDATNTYSKDM